MKQKTRMQDELMDRLRAAGHKLTQPRRAVAQWIASHDGVFSVKEIVADLSRLDTVSVYRAVELLCDLDFVHPLLTTHGEMHYEMHDEVHHHHAVCTECEKTTCVPGCGAAVKKIKGFTQLHHTLVFTGVCRSCAT